MCRGLHLNVGVQCECMSVYVCVSLSVRNVRGRARIYIDMYARVSVQVPF